MCADRGHTLVIGGGVIGMACAHYLAAAGFRVTVLDKGRAGEACSFRNCGFVCPSHVLPLAEPGAVRAALRALGSRDGAFRIRPRLDPRLWYWLWRFARRCNRRDMLASGRAIHALLAPSMELYRALGPELDCEWQERGLLFVYRDRARLDAFAPTNAILASEFGEGARRLDAGELRGLEPALGDAAIGAWHFERDAHLRPERLVHSWRASLERRAVRFIEGSEFEGFDATGTSASSARVRGATIDADAFVVATGAWTPKLARAVRCRVPIEPGKGYSMIVPLPSLPPRVPMLFPEHRVGVTPFAGGMRLGSIMEFAGYDDTIRPARLRQLRDGAAHYLREPIAESFTDAWYGWRPMTWDSTPVIGRSPGFDNVFLATGHNMLGTSMAPATGLLISELVAGERPHVDPEPYRVERFA